MSKVIKDKYGTKLTYPERTCKDCKHYPCFPDIAKCRSDFAKYGCKRYGDKG